MLDEEQPTARAQHPDGFGDGSSVVWDGAQDEGEHDRVEVIVGVGEVGGVALAEGGMDAELVRPAPGHFQGHVAQLDRRETHARRVERQGPPPPDADLQGFALGLLAQPAQIGVAARSR